MDNEKSRRWISLLWFAPVVLGCVALTLQLTGGAWWAHLAAVLWLVVSFSAAAVAWSRLVS